LSALYSSFFFPCPYRSSREQHVRARWDGLAGRVRTGTRPATVRPPVTLPCTLAFALTSADGRYIASPSSRPHPGRPLTGACPGTLAPGYLSQGRHRPSHSRPLLGFSFPPVLPQDQSKRKNQRSRKEKRRRRGRRREEGEGDWSCRIRRKRREGRSTAMPHRARGACRSTSRPRRPAATTTPWSVVGELCVVAPRDTCVPAPRWWSATPRTRRAASRGTRAAAR
jgi:hypothetical protein